MMNIPNEKQTNGPSPGTIVYIIGVEMTFTVW